MNIYLQLGSTIVVFALIAYTIGVVMEQRTGILYSKVLLFITLGVVLDITATILMVTGSSKTGISLHGVIGYSSLLAMSIDAILLWKLKLTKGFNVFINKALHTYTRYAYFWWVIAFITGLLLVVLA